MNAILVSPKHVHKNETLLAISLDRQNINLALKFSHESTSVEQLVYNMKKHCENQTVEFLKFINDVWKMFNVNWVEKNSHFNDDVSAPLVEILKLYSGSSHTNLIHLACATMELKHYTLRHFAQAVRHGGTFYQNFFQLFISNKVKTSI